jgi:predicted Zn-dependent protease
MRVSRVLQLLCVAFFSLAIASPTCGVAAEGAKQKDVPASGEQKKENAEKSESTKAGDAPQQDPLEEWAKLSKRKREIAERLQQLQKDFADADNEGKQKIREEFRQLVGEFREKLAQRMEQLAPEVYRQKPGDVDAATAVMALAYGENRFERSVEIADKLIATGHATPYVVGICGNSHFAIHDFEKARQILSEAEKKGQLDDGLSRPFLEAAADYVELWKKEQEIRKREAAAKGDEQLPRVLLKTSRGDIELELFENEAPNTVANFISLVEAKKYDGTKFHRVIPGFMAQ